MFSYIQVPLPADAEFSIEAWCAKAYMSESSRLYGSVVEQFPFTHLAKLFVRGYVLRAKLMKLAGKPISRTHFENQNTTGCPTHCPRLQLLPLGIIIPGVPSVLGFLCILCLTQEAALFGPPRVAHFDFGYHV